MTYNSQEISAEGGAPYFLYDFVSNNASYFYTDYPEDLIVDSVTYTAFPIKHTEVKQTAEMSKNNLKLTIPVLGPFADLFIGWAPDDIFSVTVKRGHFGTTETLVYWKGRVASHTIKEKEIDLKCESIFTSLRRQGARARFQRACRHAVYSPGCGLNREDYALYGDITLITGLVYTVPEAAAQADGYFTSGAIKFADGSFRLILSHVGDQLTLNRASRFAEDNLGISNDGYGLGYGNNYGGTGVTLYPGCDRTVATCENKFNNLLNQGGFKWIPSKNPMGGSSIV